MTKGGKVVAEDAHPLDGPALAGGEHHPQHAGAPSLMPPSPPEKAPRLSPTRRGAQPARAIPRENASIVPRPSSSFKATVDTVDKTSGPQSLRKPPVNRNQEA